MRMRNDAVALLLHFADIHSNSKVMCYDKTNGALPAAILNRLDDGFMYQVMDKTCHPNTVVARIMHLPRIKERWRAVPRNQPFLTGEDYATAPAVGASATEDEVVSGDAGGAAAASSTCSAAAISQWVRGKQARDDLLQSPADSLVIADDENPAQVVLDLLPYLALCGHLVVYTSFLDQLTEIFSLIRNDCVCIRISETWYRHHQVLTNRTHPTVNMSAAGGYLLTAVKVERNAAPRPRFAVITDEAHAKYNTGAGAGKRPREE